MENEELTIDLVEGDFYQISTSYGGSIFKPSRFLGEVTIPETAGYSSQKITKGLLFQDKDPKLGYFYVVVEKIIREGNILKIILEYTGIWFTEDTSSIDSDVFMEVQHKYTVKKKNQ